MLEFQTIFVSCVTAGAVVTFCAYRFSGRRGDHAELLGEICEERESLCRVMAALPEQLELAKRTKLIEARATHLPLSEATAHWLSEFETDYADAKSLESQLPSAEVGETDHSGMELDLRLAEILTLSIRALRLAEKYASLPHVDVHQPPTDTDADTHAVHSIGHPQSPKRSLSALAP